MAIKVLFVCLGNICRSPTAEGVFRNLVATAHMEDQIIIDSAGTGDWHIGKTPDVRTVAAAKLRGYDLTALRARQVAPKDFEEFDYVLAMDEANLHDLRAIAPQNHSAHLSLFLDFATQASHREVPDPYYGGEAGFTKVLDLIEDAAAGLLKHIQSHC